MKYILDADIRSFIDRAATPGWPGKDPPDRVWPGRPIASGAGSANRETFNVLDLAPNFYPVLSSLRLLDLPDWAVVATGAGAEPFGIAERQVPARMAGEGELRRGLPSELRVWSRVVVIGPPASKRDTGLGQGRKQRLVQQFVPQPAIDGEDGPAPSAPAIYCRCTDPLTGATHQWKSRQLGWTFRSTYFKSMQLIAKAR